MSVDNTHPEYDLMLPKWERCIAVCKGQDAVHDGGDTFLPRLIDQSNADYLNYVKRATFYNATWRTVVGLQGMIFRKPPTIIVPSLVEPMLKNVTLSGTPMHIFALEAAEECLKVGRVGIYVDFPVVPEGATAADGVRENYRPSMKLYKATSIINWKTKTIRNETVLSMVVLAEAIDVPEDEFTDKEKTQYRVLDLTTLDNADGSFQNVYRVRIMEVKENTDGTKEDILISVVLPKIQGKYLESIPFQFIGVDDVSWCVDEPPLIDLVDVNLSHYRSVADYEHGCHFTGLPTPIISGYTKDPASPEKFYIGSESAWVFPNPNAKATYLEFTGQGLAALEKNLEKKEGYMAILGARMLEVQVRGIEAASTAAIHRGGEQSMLASVAQAISIGLSKALGTFCQFANADGESSINLNRDFFPVPMDALTLTAIIAGWQNGAYSYDTMFANLKKGEIVPVEKTPEEEQKEIDANPAPLLNAPTVPGDVKKKAPKAKATPATPAPTQKQLQNTK